MLWVVIFQHFSCLPEMIFPFFLVKLEQSFQLFILCGFLFFCFAAFACWEGGGWFDMQAAANENRKKGKNRKNKPEKWKMFRWLLMSRLILPSSSPPRSFMFDCAIFNPKLGYLLIHCQEKCIKYLKILKKEKRNDLKDSDSSSSHRKSCKSLRATKFSTLYYIDCLAQSLAEWVALYVHQRSLRTSNWTTHSSRQTSQSLWAASQ